MEEYIVGIIHGRSEIYKLVDGIPYIQEKKDNKYKWVKTVLDQTRLKRFKKVTIDELIEFRLRHSDKS